MPTGDAYPNVGAVLFDFDEDGKIVGNEELCTGSLIEGSLDPNVAVFLTAAHSPRTRNS